MTAFHLVTKFLVVHVLTWAEAAVLTFDSGDQQDLALVQLRANARRAAEASEVLAPGAGLLSGQVIYLRSLAAGRYISYNERAGLGAPFADRRGRAGFLLVKKKDGRIKDHLPINAGDTVYLKTYRGDFIDVEEDLAQCRWKTADDWQSFTITKTSEGPIRQHDTVYLRSHLGKYLQIFDGKVKALDNFVGEKHAFAIDGEHRGAILKSVHSASEIIHSGSVVYPWTAKGTTIKVEGKNQVNTLHTGYEGMPGVLILKEEYGDIVRGSPLRTGDVVYLRTYKGYYLDVENNTVSTRYREVGPWQAFFIKKPEGGWIRNGDKVAFEAHNGEHILANKAAQMSAKGKVRGPEHRFVLELRGQPASDLKGPALRSGDGIFLQAQSGLYAGVDDINGAHVRYNNTLGRPGFFLLKVEYGEVQDGFHIRGGDVVCLKSYRGEFLDVDGHMVQARWSDPGDYQVFVVRKVDGSLTILKDGDSVAFVAHTGEHLTEFNRSLWSEGVTVNKSHYFSVYRPSFGALHDVVGRDGVIMISVEKEDQPRRSEHALQALSHASIYPVSFRATEAATALPAQLQLTCPLAEQPGSSEWCEEMGRTDEPGCSSVPEQAIADSHRRALLKAKQRGNHFGTLEENAPNWTAIIEEDAVPVDAAAFDEHFRAAWAALPEGTKLVRLGWCDPAAETPGAVEERELGRHGQLKLVSERWFNSKTLGKQYHTGGCTTGYLVHRSLLDEMLGMFPCCCGFDCCLERHLFRAPAQQGNASNPEAPKFRGPEIMVDLDHDGSVNFSQGLASFRQNGLLVQDHRPYSVFGVTGEA